MLFSIWPKNHALVVGRDDVSAVIDIINKYQNFLFCSGKIDIYDYDDNRYYVEFKTPCDRWCRMLEKFDRIKSVRVRD